MLAGSLQSLAPMFPTMFMMGAFASIYHPAGLALISHETNADNRPMALGLHGVFGSAGIGLAPLLAGVMLTSGSSWRQYYWLLSIPAVALGVFFLWRAFTSPEVRPARDKQPIVGDKYEDATDWPAFFTLTLIAMTQGFVYAAITTFLPRYLTTSSLAPPEGWSAVGTGGMLAGLVLFMGCIGQILAGWFARVSRLEEQLTWIILGNMPFLLWMAVARGWTSVVAAGGFALVHFMHQPIYNSLIAKYTPRRRRSLSYGFSFAVGFGIGSLGSMFAGYTAGNSSAYYVLCGVVGTAGCLSTFLWRRANAIHASSA